MSDDETACSIRNQYPLRNVEASVSRSVDGGDDSIARELDGGGLAHHKYYPFVGSGVKSPVWSYLDVRQALRWSCKIIPCAGI